MERGFEKISFRQFSVDISSSKKIYDEYFLPLRASKNSCGYDFFSIQDYIIHPGDIIKIPTGIRVYMPKDEFLMIVIRSSMGFKYNVRMCNQVGIIDSDYYDSDNEGHIWICLQNEGNEDYIIRNGDAIAQGIFMKYLTCGDEVSNIRNGGIGSTDRRDNNE